jgi:hypothetical protein
MALGMIPGQPAPQDGQNAVTSGGMEQGQAPEEMLQQIVAGGQMPEGEIPPEASAPPEQMNGGVPNG